MKVILRNDNKKRGKVLIDTDNLDILLYHLRYDYFSLMNNESDFIDIEKNGKLVATAYYNDHLSLDSCEYYIGRVA